MVTIRKAEPSDRDFWFTLDRHISPEMFAAKQRDGMLYLLCEDGAPAGLLRYGLFWDNLPFCNLLYVADAHQRKGYGRMLMQRWERDMAAAGYGLALVSTQADEDAQHFYRKIGYTDCGALLLPFPGYEQPAELFLGKPIQ